MTRHEPPTLTRERATAPLPVADRRIIQSYEFLTQIAEPSGIHSAYPTAHLNALIYREFLGRPDAQRVQDALTGSERYKERWKYTWVGAGKARIKVWQDYPEAISDAVQEVTGARVVFEPVDLTGLGDPEAFIREKLEVGHAIVAGSGRHAVTAVGLEPRKDAIVVIDPLFPAFPSSINLWRFADVFKKADATIKLV
ncbi:hypothetical protein A3G67_01365 [Candidatus Roizmanbacteria bacterium RIFCSPLOWO2_12_FULL_40_12]|uniref:Uncharacterized protein n=1 Tax=Candidatus Roizmanbacteria bacterium RIFCSPLOWO2_01_FULL_40_42 TaxID=1802066 RepID=A0A1F7J564_9BACT|nr:MAG: hypothetical protein A2779_01840 [Candidatus Roizmanbacteria bacterium RIFCSPHIGHO2_01_FULL_40_98]OGK28551.1 MAG: hypothetical protein A3C31_01160 [Candidatus Roizmanbacteria bacterium RIFCSPHIGHO2_02_FULL_40_53]OGK36548.1 MAG: hypothetical protein A3E69_03400 [Candidatus Roizmanbacteria bacterium RIFCSPHIGHO2_12_FULL_40_130]OGK50739.1 MAG: hypothetical protein A3B50_04550 [Candidatus Roizmanbacteria bacterium RIFCSPLOWO2_01_FULL_40_42]OGK59674.1 MAG: hypothetical protein A3H84_00285 [C